MHCSRGLPVVSSFHTNFDQYSGHYGVGWAKGLIWRYLRWFHNSTRETYVPSNTTIRELSNEWASSGCELWRRGVDSEVFRPDRPGRLEVRRALGWSPDDVVITYVSRIAPEKNVDYLADALAIVASRRPDVRILFVGDGPSRPALETRIGADRSFCRIPAGSRPGRPLRRGRPLRFRKPDRDTRQCRPRGDVVRPSGGRASRPAASARPSSPDRPEFWWNPTSPPSGSPTAMLWLIEQSDERRRMAEAARAYAVSQSWEAIMASLRLRYQSVIGKSVDLLSQTIDPTRSEPRRRPCRPFDSCFASGTQDNVRRDVSLLYQDPP